MTKQSESLRLADRLARDPVTFPGCYPVLALTADGGTLCPACCKAERSRIAVADPSGRDGWLVSALFIHWEGAPAVCDHCGNATASAYGDPECEGAA